MALSRDRSVRCDDAAFTPADPVFHTRCMRRKDEAKRKAILLATMAEVVAGGLAGASMAAIAARAGVSQGTIYLYYADKNALLRAALIEAKRGIHQVLMEAAADRSAPADAIRAQWFALHDHVGENPAPILFAEQALAAGLAREEDEPELSRMASEMLGPIERGLGDGTLHEAPAAAIASALTGPAVQLARRRAQGMAVDPDIVIATFDLLWRGVAASQA